MTTGKPDFNLNSFGIKYLTKDEVQEFLEKYEIPTGADQAALRTERAKQPQGTFQASESSKKLLTPTTPKPKETPAVATNQTISAPNAAGDKKLEGGTRSQFMSRETPSKLSHTERKLRQDMEESGTKVDTSGIVTQRQKPQPQTKPDKGKAPNRPTEHIGSIVDGGKVQGMDSKGNKRSISDASVKKDPKERTSAETTGKKGTKQLPKHVGDAPEGVKSETEKIGGRNVKVGVGVKANEQFKKDPQGELTSSQKPKEDKPDGRKVDLNSQHRSSKGVSAHNKRGKDNGKWYNEEQRLAFKKIDPKDRNAQAKYHSAQEKKYGKSVSTPKKLSSAGQAIKDKLKKSNDIILDMNILKLDLMKVESSTPHAQFGSDLPAGRPSEGELPKHENFAYVGRRGKRYKTEAELHAAEKTPKTRNLLEERKRRETKRLEQEKYDKDTRATIGEKLQMVTHSASETVFKAISLKLDLTTLK